MRKFYVIYILFILTYSIGNAQQSPLYSQYVLNEFVVNPSMAGIDGMTSINFTGRKQWIGWKLAPETYSASISGRILKSPYSFISKKKPNSKIRKGPSGNVGLGASVLNDRNGAVVRTGLNFTYAYHIEIEDGQLSFGLSFLLQQFKIDQDLAELSSQPGDPVEGLIGKSTYIPDAGFGMNYSYNKFNIGFSAFQLFQSPIKFDGQEIYFKELKQTRYYHILGTFKDELKGISNKWEYEPSVIIRATETLQASADISLRLIYNKEYWAGISYRTSGDFVLLMGLKLNRFYFGYSFDYGFNEISRMSYGSHEALIAIKLGDSTKRYRHWERY